MTTKKVCILGGAGFVGQHIAHQLVARGISVRVVTSRREHAKALFVLPGVDIVEANIHDENQLARAVSGCDAVVNLIGVLHDSKKRGRGFQQAHAELARKLIEACCAQNISRLLHMSALKAEANAPSAYLRSKAEAEKRVRDSGLRYTIFCPSVIFGHGDRFLNLFASLLSIAPVLPLAGANAKFQPIWVDDVARAFAVSLVSAETIGKTYNLCGPTIYTLRDLVKYVARIRGQTRAVIGLPDAVASMQALVMEFLPGKLMSRDNVLSMQVDNVCGCDFPAELGFTPATLESIAPEYLSGETHARFAQFRARR